MQKFRFMTQLFPSTYYVIDGEAERPLLVRKDGKNRAQPQFVHKCANVVFYCYNAFPVGQDGKRQRNTPLPAMAYKSVADFKQKEIVEEGRDKEYRRVVVQIQSVIWVRSTIRAMAKLSSSSGMVVATLGMGYFGVENKLLHYRDNYINNYSGEYSWESLLESRFLFLPKLPPTLR